jgi:hypothetical protein
MSEDLKTATGMIVQEVAEMVPQADKNTAGRDLGATLKNVGSIARDLTDLLAGVASIPRRTAEFMARALANFRQIPEERRRTPPPKLLLEAAQGYAQTDDDDLRECFERLVESAMDGETSSLVHPSFVSSLTQMSGLDARFMKVLTTGEIFPSFSSLRARLGIQTGEPLTVTLDNLEKRLRYVSQIGSTVKMTRDPPLGVKEFIFVLDGGTRGADGEGTVYMATPLGRVFLKAVGAAT